MTGEKLAAIGLPALALVFLLVGVIIHEPREAEPEPGPPQVFDKEFAAAYVKAGCWECHSVSTLEPELIEAFGVRAGGVQPLGPDLAGVGNRYHPDWHEAHFWKPDDVVAGSAMPAQRHMFKPGEQKLNETGERVIKFMLMLKAPSLMTKPWPEGRHLAPEGNANSGAKLFARECAGCHGSAGMGDGLASKFFDVTRKPPALGKGELILLRKDETPRDTIYTIITNGLPGTGMPSFGNKLNDNERADLAAYVVKISGR
jgi:mono/diheme cytochrome c family protein